MCPVRLAGALTRAPGGWLPSAGAGEGPSRIVDALWNDAGQSRDFDGDGNADLIARHATTHDLYLYQGNGSGGFKSGTGGVIGNNWGNFDTIL